MGILSFVLSSLLLIYTTPMAGAVEVGTLSDGDLLGSFSDESLSSALIDENGQRSICQFTQGVDNPHISSTSATAAVQAHGWWVNINCSARTATVKVGIMKSYNNSNPDDYWDVGTQGIAYGVISGGGSGHRATAHYNCPVGETAWYKAWVDVDLDGLIDSNNLNWKGPVRITCRK